MERESKDLFLIKVKILDYDMLIMNVIFEKNELFYDEFIGN